MIRFFNGIFLFAAFLQADFISKYEYGERLYQEPRGVSCAKCHGTAGEGSVVAKITKDNGNVNLIAPAIRNIPMERIARSLRKGSKVMPVYHLTFEEIEALYIFLNTQK